MNTDSCKYRLNEIIQKETIQLQWQIMDSVRTETKLYNRSFHLTFFLEIKCNGDTQNKLIIRFLAN